ncbi:ATP-dependent DNA ligase [Agromyces archimandritae]|uniref:ATP-dependent DNA ligase n=1 Tax=Agromyces archimandritae TaxID=2781962 RepID=A0A975IML2_9MICO|nr:ATP-dependent DNA ligase [Agromyces archimandritae]QTX03575.1 ATP-dependent DNA ligase [Agromyces archimandritae]
MGKLIYNSSPRELDIDDRTLAHLRVAILGKLRRGESFAMTWDHGLDHGSGRTTLWLHPAIPLQFVFSGNRPPRLNRLWIQQLMLQANTAAGLQPVPEPDHDEPFEDGE